MLFAVVRLRHRGRPLTRAEIEAQPRAVGDLHFAAPPHAQTRDPLKRPTKVAELRGEAIGGIEHTLIHNLMEPVVVTITAAEIVLFGFEIDHIDGVLHEFAQGWLVRHVAPGEKRMRRGAVPM
jgi:hypothetical protein